MRAWCPSVLVCLAVVGLNGNVVVGVDVATVSVGDLGNVADARYPYKSYGSVSYPYRIGKYEVTAGQYCEFLNKVAGVDKYGLYYTSMSNTSYGCGITRSGGGTTTNPFAYSVAAGFVNRPVNYVSYWDACRFANWLHNRQPTGAQGAGTTETGAYTLNGMTSIDSPIIGRNSDAKWAVASEDEWYKAAYYKGGSPSAGYWDYPTRSDAAPGRDMNDASGNNANYYSASNTQPIDSGKYTTVGGEFQNSAGPYGTFDQGGNLSEWNEVVIYYSYPTYATRGVRGGSFDLTDVSYLHASCRGNQNPTCEGRDCGFRVVNLLKPGDFDGDGDVDSADLDLFKACVSGPAIPYARGCSSEDLDTDGDVDQADFGIFQRCYPVAGVLSMTQSEGFESTGFQGGPFTPASKTYTLTNTGGLPITWTAATSQTWITLSKTGGTLAAGTSDTVDVLLNAETSSLAAGRHSNTLTFTNTVNHRGDTTRAVSLTINPPSMAFIPAGEFKMGDSFNEGQANERPVHAVFLDAFYMDKYEVTNQQFAEALNWAKAQGNLIYVTGGVVYKYDSKYAYPYCDTTTSSAYSRITWNGSTFGVMASMEEHPVVRVSWYGMVAYANWRSGRQSRPLCYDLATWDCNFGHGYRLPTEAEWEKAARGGVEGHRFPWSDSDTIQHTRANYYTACPVTHTIVVPRAAITRHSARKVSHIPTR